MLYHRNLNKAEASFLGFNSPGPQELCLGDSRRLRKYRRAAKANPKISSAVLSFIVSDAEGIEEISAQLKRRVVKLRNKPASKD